MQSQQETARQSMAGILADRRRRTDRASSTTFPLVRDRACVDALQKIGREDPELSSFVLDQLLDAAQIPEDRSQRIDFLSELPPEICFKGFG